VTPVKTSEERIEELEKKLIQMEARSGMVRLSTSALTLIWFAFIAAASAMMFVVRLDSELSSHIKNDDNAALRYLVETHIAQPGHAVGLERLEDLRDRVAKLEREVHR
jgi:polyhydroxyalkanoate synthesis regulator phasin